jgi:RNA polymerase sigma factor (sigma-70 family)
VGDSRLGRLIRRFAATLGPGAEGDGELLDLFVRQRDEAAFEALLLRHGAMVMGVCRRVLGNCHDTEDAFQATFLVLARKAGSVWPRHRVGNWLHGVAYRTALAARRASARRRLKEAQAVPREQAPDGVGDGLREVLDRELSCLPASYREVIILSDLEEKGRKEVARELGCPEGTVASRLTRARSLLARRLSRHGLPLALGTLTALLSREAASASVPASLSCMVRAACLSAAGQAAAQGLIPDKVAALAEGVLRNMWLTRLKTVAVAVLAVGMLGPGTGLLTYRTLAAGHSSRPTRTASNQGKQEKPSGDRKKLQGTWEIEELIVEGQKVLPNEQGKGEIIFKGDELHFVVRSKGDGKERNRRHFTYRLHPDKKPKVMETTAANGPHKGKQISGIYKLEGDTLTLCLGNAPEAKKPIEFRAARGSGFCLFKLKRAKP